MGSDVSVVFVVGRGINSEPKISQFQLEVFVKKTVLEFNVQMGEVLRVDIPDGLGEL